VQCVLQLALFRVETVEKVTAEKLWNRNTQKDLGGFGQGRNLTTSLRARSSLRRLCSSSKTERPRGWRASGVHGGKSPHQYVKLIANGEVDEILLDDIEDYVKRQRKRLERGAKDEAGQPRRLKKEPRRGRRGSRMTSMRGG
jgi:hypothetical protein